MGIQTLEELKAQNAEEESAQQEEVVTDEAEAEDVESDEQPDIETESDDDVETEGGEDEEVEAWLQGDQPEEQEAEKSVPLPKHIEVRTKLKSTVKEQNSEIESLKAEIEQLKSQSVAPQLGDSIGPRPKRDDFYEHEDPDGAYEDALYEWRSQAEASKNQLEAQKQAQEKHQAQIQEAVASHYQRAEKLIEKHNIDASVYQQADRRMRQAIDDVAPGSGDAIFDSLLGQMGDGSEKVMFYVGSNPQRTDQLKSALMTDPSGLKAMRLIGRWEAEAITPKKKVTRAQKPAKRADGGTDTAASSEAKLKKQYAAAHAKGNYQQSINIREQAKAAGFNPNNW